MIEFKYIHKDIHGNITTEIEYKTHEEGTLPDLMQEFRRFLLAVSFHPDTVSEYIPEE